MLRGTHMSIDVIRAAKEFRLPHRQYLFLPSVDCFCLPHLFNLQMWGSILQIRKSRKKERKNKSKEENIVYLLGVFDTHCIFIEYMFAQ